MNRILKIILILIATFFLILGIIWLIGRNSALKNGKEPLTFRQFLGLGTKKNAAETIPNDNSSIFNGGSIPNAGTNGDGTGTGGANGTGTGADAVNVSQFSNGGSIGPGGNGGANGTNGNNGNGTISTDGSGNPDSSASGDGTISVDSSTNGSAGSQQECSDEDTNIDFTPEQIAQLNILQNRFYALAQGLHSDADVATELANHDAFTLKAADVLSLYAYCEAKLPTINATADARLKAHVATPFWTSYGSDPSIAGYVNARTKPVLIPSTDPAPESFSFIDYASVNKGNGKIGFLDLTNPQYIGINGSALQDIPNLLPAVENIFRINLW